MDSAPVPFDTRHIVALHALDVACPKLHSNLVRAIWDYTEFKLRTCWPRDCPKLTLLAIAAVTTVQFDSLAQTYVRFAKGPGRHRVHRLSRETLRCMDAAYKTLDPGIYKVDWQHEHKCSHLDAAILEKLAAKKITLVVHMREFNIHKYESTDLKVGAICGCFQDGVALLYTPCVHAVPIRIPLS